MKNYRAMLLGCYLFLIIGVTGCSFIHEKVQNERKISGESVNEVQLDMNHVDLVLKPSSDNQIYIHQSGSKAKGDDWSINTFVQGSTLIVKSAFTQKMYINFVDQTDRKVIVSLPKKKYNSIHLKISPQWETFVEIPIEKEKVKKLHSREMKKGTKIHSVFGHIKLD